MTLARANLGLLGLLSATLLVAFGASVDASHSAPPPAPAARTTARTAPPSSPKAAAAGTLASRVRMTAPKHALRDRLVAVTVALPARVAAVEGRLLLAKGTAELMGVVPAKGSALRRST